MKPRSDAATQYVANVVSQWESARTLTVLENEAGIDDPYFYLSLDIFLDGDIPDYAVREQAFSECAAFEATKLGTKDRFLFDNLPVRLEYKKRTRIEALLQSGSDATFVASRDNGTYLFYRVVNGRVLFDKDGWLETVRPRLESLPDAFWTALREGYVSRTEHDLSDLSAAQIRGDELFFFLTLGSLLKDAMSCVYAENKAFEPPPRFLWDTLIELPSLPEQFVTRFSYLYKHRAEQDMSRTREIAELLVRSLVLTV